MGREIFPGSHSKVGTRTWSSQPLSSGLPCPLQTLRHAVPQGWGGQEEAKQLPRSQAPSAHPNLQHSEGHPILWAASSESQLPHRAEFGYNDTS